MKDAPEPVSPVRRYVGAVAAVGVLCAAASVALLAWGHPVAMTSLDAIEAVGLVLVLVGLHRFPFTFYWRDHRLVVSLDEAAIVVGLLVVPAPLLALCVPLATGAVQWWSGPAARIKRVFNVAQYGIAGTATATAFLALDFAGVPALVAAPIATLAFGTIANLLLAGVFARLDHERALRVFRERFLVQGANSALVGVSGGLAIVALWQLHPLAVFAAAPFAYFMRRYWRLYAHADRELDVRRRLAGALSDLVGTSDVPAVAQRVLLECERLIDCGRAELVLHLDGAPDAFRSDFGSGPRLNEPPIVAPLPGRKGGQLGDLTVWPRVGKEPFGDQERALVNTIAAQAASAIESARAIQEAARQREAMAQHEKLSTLGTLVAGVAHEINNPLTFMRGNLEICRDGIAMRLAGPALLDSERRFLEETAMGIQVSLEGVDRLTGIASSLKNVARRGSPERRPEDVNAVVRDVVSVVRSGLPRAVRLDLDLAPDLRPVLSRAGELHQVILNLVKNSVEALDGRHDGFVKVRTYVQGADVCLDVVDNGAGIPAEVQRSLFTPFFTTKESGTGLGLSISRGIVHAHGGELVLVSTVGQGTAFTLRLPAA